MLNQMRKYIVILCLPYTLVSITFTAIAHFNGATSLTINSIFWAFAVCCIITVLMAICDKIPFASLIVEIMVRAVIVTAVAFGISVFAIGIIQRYAGIIALLIILLVVFIFVYVLFYAKEWDDCNKINDKLRRDNLEDENIDKE
jgi:Zn-dependent membrane protease YugP